MYRLETFYKTKAWEDLRRRLMMERVDENGQLICAKCGKPILKAYDCIGHHKIELTDDNVNDIGVSLNPDNIELIHFRCHNIEHGRFEGFRQEVFLVYGPPMAGKTTWVRENARPDDLILDLDKIWEAICISDREHKPNALKANVFGIRDAILEQIKMRRGRWRTAFVIGTYPLEAERARLCDQLRAEEIFIDTDEETCMARASDSPEWMEYIREWFEMRRV